MKMVIVMVMVALAGTASADNGDLDAASVERFADLALVCVHEEYPNKIGHVMNSDDDVDPHSRRLRR